MYLISILLQDIVWGTQVLIVALALYVVYAASRIIHLAVGVTGATAAYALYMGITLGWPLSAAILFALLIAVVLGLLSARLLEPCAVRQESLLGLLVSFALGMSIEAILAMIFGTDGKSLQSGVLSVFQFKEITLDLPGLITIGLGLVLALCAFFTVQYTPLGRLLRGIAEHAPLARSLGVSTSAMRYGAYTLAALLGGVVISLAGWHTALTPSMGFNFVIAAFMALLLGGVQDIRGTLVASYALAIVPGFIIGVTPGLSENWRAVFVFCIAALVLALRPQGIFVKATRET